MPSCVTSCGSGRRPRGRCRWHRVGGGGLGQRLSSAAEGTQPQRCLGGSASGSWSLSPRPPCLSEGLSGRAPTLPLRSARVTLVSVRGPLRDREGCSPSPFAPAGVIFRSRQHLLQRDIWEFSLLISAWHPALTLLPSPSVSTPAAAPRAPAPTCSGGRIQASGPGPHVLPRYKGLKQSLSVLPAH